MDLLQEAKKSNKKAFNELIEQYNHIFYKTARIFFISDDEIYKVIESSLAQAFRELINVDTEEEFLCWTLKILISKCEKLKDKNSKDINKQINSKQTSINITDKVAISQTTVGDFEYQAYRKSSVVEEYITSIEPEHRVPALLYFYANLSIQDISKILKTSEFHIQKIIDKSRTKIYEMIKNKEVDL